MTGAPAFRSCTCFPCVVTSGGHGQQSSRQCSTLSLTSHTRDHLEIVPNTSVDLTGYDTNPWVLHHSTPG